MVYSSALPSLYCFYIQYILLCEVSLNPDLEQLKQRRLVWRGRDAARPLEARASGWPELDARLGGLPGAGVVMIQTPPGIGELRLLWPSMEQQSRLTVLITPPYRIGVEAWLGGGVAQEKLLVLHPDSTQAALWATEQSLKSGSCDSSCLWLTQRLQTIQARRLQLAARAGQSTLFLFAPPALDLPQLPIDLHLVLSPAAQGVRVEVRRRRQGRPLAPFTVIMTEHWPELTRPQVHSGRAPSSPQVQPGAEAI
ncbi:hypothetical protein EDC38_0784 [Marinimicrobium koreense]|uniref:Translesion DNA synthesis-associated protein ImuA n=1 Tax=Marinimicrobium koreense TaxID=306545 RepID=A0A3N1NVG9_9GAMM|nr:hypothetical protein EDC38_0784 [Marinimicrobium koreense]